MAIFPIVVLCNYYFPQSKSFKSVVGKGILTGVPVPRVGVGGLGGLRF